MGLFTKKHQPVRVRGLTAAATSVDLTDPKASQRLAQQRKRPLAFQSDAWRYFDELSEVRAYGRWMGDTQSRVRLFPAIAADNPDQSPTPATEAEGVNPAELDLALELLERLRSPDGGREEIQRVFGLGLAIPGECWLVGTDNDPDYMTQGNLSGERWRAFSNEEVVAQEGRWGIAPWPNAKMDDVEWLDPESSSLVRIYRAHGRWRNWPDSPMRSANLICEELLLATQAIMGVLRSRIPAGILPIPEDLEIGDGADDDEEATADSDDPVLRELLKHLSTPLSDPRSAAALVPYLLKVPTEYLDKLKMLDIAKAIDPEVATRIELLIRRLAIAVDMPPEALTGTAGLNHWSAWLVGEDGVRTHVEPYTGIYAGALTTQYLRPRMEAAGVSDTDKWLFHWDASECIAHPDQKENAIQGWDRIVISDHTLVGALGFSDDDMPDEEEVARRIEQAKVLKPTTAPVDATNVDAKPPVTASAAPPALTAASTGRSIGRRWSTIEAHLLRDLVLDSDAALRRMLERAQARIRSAAQRSPDTRAVAAAVSDNERLALALGRATVVDVLALGEDDLFAGGLGALGARFTARTQTARDQAVQELRRLGVDPDPDLLADYDTNGQQNSEEGAATLTALLTVAAGALLFTAVDGHTPQPTAGESDRLLAVSPRDVREALTVAGGGVVQPELALIGEHGGRVPETSGGVLAGQDFAAFLDALPDFERDGFVWEVGAPSNPFEPHQSLGDIGDFSGWDDPNLAADPSDFPFVSVYAPQDHDGCQCTVTPNGTVTVDEEPPEGD